MHDRTAELHRVMKESKLTCKKAADMLKVSEGTVRVWRCKGERVIPEHVLDALKYRIGEDKKVL